MKTRPTSPRKRAKTTSVRYSETVTLYYPLLTSSTGKFEVACMLERLTRDGIFTLEPVIDSDQPVSFTISFDRPREEK